MRGARPAANGLTLDAVAVVGVGLIGGSIALAARERLGATVAGYDAERAGARARRSSAARSTARAPASPRRSTGAEAVFVAVPVGALPDAVVADALGRGRRDCVVTDVGSTKRAIVAAASTIRGSSAAIRSRAPRAPGVEHARADLFEGATWYLTPTSTTVGILYERLHRLLRGLGARPAAIDAETHDAILATVSHLPARARQRARRPGRGGRSPPADERLPGDRPELPRRHPRGRRPERDLDRHLPVQPRRAGARGSSDTIAALERGRRRARAGATPTWITELERRRRRGPRGGCSRPSSPAAPLFELRASVPNRPGVVAELALELGRAGVNIADMALYPAPDMSEGVVALWVAGDARGAARPGAGRRARLPGGRAA